MKRVEGAKPFVSHLCPVDPGVTLLACHKSFKIFRFHPDPVTMIQQSGRGSRDGLLAYRPSADTGQLLVSHQNPTPTSRQSHGARNGIMDA